MTPILIIAEPGSTHEGSLNRMLDLITMTKEIGANVYKSQWVSSPARLAERRRAPEYEAAYEAIAYPERWNAKLAAACHELGLEYWCSVYLPEDAAIVAPHVDTLKISSFEMLAEDLRAAVIATGKTYVISTGLASIEEARRAALSLFIRAMLHCVSAYPTPVDQLNLAAIGHLTLALDGYGVPVGFSDHSTHKLTGAMAVAAGAQLVEFHVRLHDTPSTNPDYCVSRDHVRALDYIEAIRLAETMLGDGRKTMQEAERAWAKYRVVG